MNPPSMRPHSAMPNFIGLILATMLALVSIGSVEAKSKKAWVRTILHDDGSRTVSKQDQSTRVLEEFTYDKRNVLVSKKVFQIDGEGRALQGAVFDSRDNLLARIEFGFDSYGRMVEERMFDARGGVVRRILYGYDSSGQRKRPQAFTYGDGSLRNPIAVDADTLAPTIRTPDINGGTAIPGDVIQDGMRVIPSTSATPKPAPLPKKPQYSPGYIPKKP